MGAVFIIGIQGRQVTFSHTLLILCMQKDTWSEEEDKVLIQAHAEIGNKWAEIAKRLPGRTENSIKNHWNATKRRQYSKRKCRSKYPRGSLLQEYIKSLNLDSGMAQNRRRASASNAINNDPALKAPTQPQTTEYDPDYDFNEVPDFCFDGNMFQESCSIDSLLDDMPCAPIVDEKMPSSPGVDENMACMDESDFEMDMAECEVKKDLDLVEMISQSMKTNP